MPVLGLRLHVSLLFLLFFSNVFHYFSPVTAGGDVSPMLLPLLTAPALSPYMPTYLLMQLEGRPRISDVSPSVWNLRAVSLIPLLYNISSLVLLPGPVALSAGYC